MAMRTLSSTVVDTSTHGSHTTRFHPLSLENFRMRACLLPRHSFFPPVLLLPLTAMALAGCGGDETLNPVPTAADIELVVDDLGITHVYAKSDTDALFGAGYAMAEDRLFQMEVTRRSALGTSAELFGEAALKQDITARTVNFKKLGEASFAAFQKDRPEEAALIEAWTKGVNYRIDEIARGEAPEALRARPG